MTTDLVPADFTEKRSFLRSAKKYFLAKKAFFFSKKNIQNVLKDWYLFGKRVLFCLHDFSRAWLENGVHWEVNPLLGPKTRISAQNSVFFTGFCQWPLVALGKTVHFTPWDQFFDFSFPSYSIFLYKKKRLTRQKFFPHPTVGAQSASNSPSAGPSGLRNSRAGWITFYGEVFPRCWVSQGWMCHKVTLSTRSSCHVISFVLRLRSSHETIKSGFLPVLNFKGSINVAFPTYPV